MIAVPKGARITCIEHARGYVIYHLVLKDGTPKVLRVPR